MSEKNTSSSADPKQAPKKVKSKGIIRWEAIIPTAIIITGIGAYSHLFLDHHLRKALEWGSYEALGSEVNIGSLKTSVLNASLEINNIAITNSDKPTHNSLEIGSIRFSMLWDALLRAKVVVNEAAVEGLRYDTARTRPGKVKPPPPPSNEPSAAEKLSQEALGMIEKQNENNVMGDLAALLGGGDSQEQISKLENKLESKQMLASFETALKEKQLAWDKRLKELPSAKEIEALGQSLQKIKTKDFKTPQELQNSLTEFDKILKEADTKYKAISAASSDAGSDLKQLNADLKSIEEQIKKDIKDLEAHFKIPSLDAAALGRSLFLAQINPYLSKVAHYRALAYKYLPPKFTKKSEGEAQDDNFQPHPRAQGITYEFGRPNSYPLVWIKRTGISSQAGQGGVIKGEILNITTHQQLTGKPTTLNIAGNFPDAQLAGLNFQLSLDNRPAESVIQSKFKIASYPFAEKTLSDSKDLKIVMAPKNGSIDLEAQLIGLKKLDLKLLNHFDQVQFSVNSSNNIVQEVLANIFAAITKADINATIQGTIPSVAISVSSNVGPEIAKGLEQQISKKIEEAKKRLQLVVEEEVGKKKKEIDAQIAKLNAQVTGEIEKLKVQLEGQKKQVDEKIKAAKADSENKAKGAIEKEAKKAAEDLKKKLGF